MRRTLQLAVIQSLSGKNVKQNGIAVPIDEQADNSRLCHQSNQPQCCRAANDKSSAKTGG